MNEKRSPHAGVGVASLLVVFSVLCMTVLALLSWQTARNQSELVDRIGAASEAYYKADADAQHIRRAVESGRETEVDGVSISWNNDTATYQCKAGETLALKVELRVSEGGSEILRWQTVATGDWQADETIKVWDGT